MFQARWFLAFGALNAAIAVALGAAAAHALKAQLAAADPGGLFSLALQYHQMHALGLVTVGLAAARFPTVRPFAWSGWLLLVGIVLFSGNLYLRSLGGIHVFHAVTPLGGISFIAGWLAFAAGALRLGKDDA